MGVNATGTLGVAGRAPKTRESRRRRLRGGLGSGCAPFQKIYDFFSQNGVIWCILGVLFLRFMCPMDCSCMINILGGGGRQHRTTPAGQILGVATPATPAALTPMLRNSHAILDHLPPDRADIPE